MKPYVDVPGEPLYNRKEHRELYEEQQVCRVERMMTKGFHRKSQLTKVLKITEAEVDRYIPRVLARWEMLGSWRDHARHRGEALHRLDLIEQSLWALLEPKPDEPELRVTDHMKILGVMLKVHDRRTKMLGLTPKVIERINMEAGNSSTFSKEAAAHQRMAMMAARMLEIIEERYGPGSSGE